jgi:hypothetical protein
LYEDEEKTNEENALKKSKEIEGDQEPTGSLESQDPSKNKQLEE